MNAADKKRYALLWNRVESLLFSPRNIDKECDWCMCFMRSIDRCWGAGIIAPGKAYPQCDELSMPLRGFSLSYDFGKRRQHPPSFSIRMSFENVGFACQDVDKFHASRVDLLEPPDLPTGSLLSHYSADTIEREQSLREDTKWVLDRYLMHPCAHVHIAPDVLDFFHDYHAAYRDVVHEIRLSMGCENPFAALFQHRIQFILGTDKASTKIRREAERDRLTDVVVKAILERADQVPSGTLFEIK